MFASPSRWAFARVLDDAAALQSTVVADRFAAALNGRGYAVKEGGVEELGREIVEPAARF